VPRRLSFSKSRVILAEGEEDATVVRVLLSAYPELTNFDVSPNIDVGGVGGNSGFYKAVVTSDAMPTFEPVTHVVLIADNDDPAASFGAICAQIERARSEGNLTRNWGRPATPGVSAAGDPSVSVWMWPASNAQPGCLETLLWRIVERKYPNVAKCVRDACTCADVDRWSAGKLDKARIRCFVALAVERNPAISLSLLRRDAPDIIPIKSRVLRPFLQFLRSI
jgi:hypothetical protein